MLNFFKKRPILSFCVLAYAYLWAGGFLFLSGILPPFGEWAIIYKGQEIDKVRLWRTLLIWTPNFAAITVLGIASGRRAVKGLFKKFLLWRVGWKWWLIAFGVPIGLAVLSLCLHVSTGGSLNKILWADLGLIFLVLLAQSVTESGIGEEAGWRGFALPKLQERFNPLLSSIVLGLVWAFWHSPLFFYLKFSFIDIVNFAIMIVCLSIIYTWIYNGSGGSLLMIAVIHNTGNTVDATVSTRGSPFAAVIGEQALSEAFNVVLLVFVLGLVIFTRGRLGFSRVK